MTQARTRVKICGLTRLEDVHGTVQAGADAIGLVFHPDSSRAISLEQARVLRNAVPAFVDVVALFVNAPPAQVQAVIDQVRPDLLQFQGDEPSDYCASFGQRYLRAFRVGGPGLDSPAAVLHECRAYAGAAAWLFDSYSPGYGGSGKALDASLLSALATAPDSRRMVLAGGLNAGNVAASIKSIHPFAVDVSSGVEAAPGIKSIEKVQAFIRAVRTTDTFA